MILEILWRRNENLIRFFTDHGVMVCGCDHIGHGRSSKKEDYGYFGEQEWMDLSGKKYKKADTLHEKRNIRMHRILSMGTALGFV